MKKIIKLTESDLKKIIQRVIVEAEEGIEPWMTGSNPSGKPTISKKSIMQAANDSNPPFMFDYVFRDTFNDNGFPKIYFVKNGNSFTVFYSETTDDEAKPVPTIDKLPMKSDLGFLVNQSDTDKKKKKFTFNAPTQSGIETARLVQSKGVERNGVVYVNDNGIPEMGKIVVDRKPSEGFEMNGKVIGKSKVKDDVGNKVGFDEYTVIDGLCYIPIFVAQDINPITYNEDKQLETKNKPLRPQSSLKYSF